MSDTQREPTEFKTVTSYIWETKEGEEDLGIVEHLISVFGVEDLGGDIVHPGAFTKTLQERKDRIRVLDMHQRRSTANAIGVPLDIWEIDREGLPTALLEEYPEATGGLKARTQFLMDTPEGKGAFVRLKTKAVKDFSFAYDTLDSDFSESLKSGSRVRNLRTVRLWEYGPTLFGMNPAAQAISAKSAGGSGPEDKRVDVTENTIQIRVRDSGGFQEGSFRTIKITAGIQARIGRLKGETSTTVQAYIFDKEKYTRERAEAWVKEHKKALVIFVPEEKDDDPDPEPGGPDECICPECGHKEDKKRGVPCREVKCPKCGHALVAKVDNEDDKAAEQALQLKVLEIEQSQVELALEAGPDVEPPTS